MKIRWSVPAKTMLDSIFDYIAVDNADAAWRTIERIESSVLRLARMPFSGRVGQIAGTRELPVPGTPYIVLYRIEKNSVHILTIWHGAQNWPNFVFLERPE